MLTKKYGELNTFMSTKTTLNMRMQRPFHNKSGVNLSSENVWMSNYMQQNNLFFSQNETPSKRGLPKYLIAFGDFLYKVFKICFRR